MRYGPLVFLAALFAMASSWMGFVLVPQLQLGGLQETNTVPAGAVYPLGRPGLARQGLAVYRANGCAACHTQQIGQTGTACDVVLAEPGTNQAALLTAMTALPGGPSEDQARRLLTELPKTILTATNKEDADAVAKDLSVGGAKAQVWIVPQGPDIARGWGKRRTVAEDFLYDYPVMLGTRRVGPDLADVGTRRPDPNWQFRHLYAPQVEVPGSLMPPYRFLFEKRRIEHGPSPDALVLPVALAPEPGYEVVPTRQAKALVAYLASLQANAPLFDAPLSVAEAASTNAAAASATNSPGAATNAPAR